VFSKSFADDLIFGDLGHVTLRMARCPVILIPELIGAHSSKLRANY